MHAISHITHYHCQSQKVITATFSSKQLLAFRFTEQNNALTYQWFLEYNVLIVVGIRCLLDCPCSVLGGPSAVRCGQTLVLRELVSAARDSTASVTCGPQTAGVWQVCGENNKGSTAARATWGMHRLPAQDHNNVRHYGHLVNVMINNTTAGSGTQGSLNKPCTTLWPPGECIDWHHSGEAISKNNSTETGGASPANSRFWMNADLVVNQRLRHWAHNKSTLQNTRVCGNNMVHQSWFDVGPKSATLGQH